VRHVSLALLILAIFAATAVWVRWAMTTGAKTQSQLAQAEFYRGRLLRLQLDEETGIRGYAATGSRVFLQPYRTARVTFDGTAQDAVRTFAALGLDLQPLLRERAINRMWLNEFAQPVLASPRATRRLDLQIAGKSLVDDFRENDRQLVEAIDRKSRELEAATDNRITRMLTVSLAFGIAIVIVVAVYGVSQERLQAQVRAAEVLQGAFLGRELPAFAHARFDAAYVPAREETRVGGDWFDAYKLSDERVLFSIGDVAGHGLEAAVVMSRVRQSIAAIGTFERDPAMVLRRANEALLLQDSHFVTAICGFADMQTGTIAFACAGHPPMLLLRPDGEIELLSTLGPPLGALERPSYATSVRNADPHSMLVLYTDGLTEHRRDAAAGERELAAAVKSIDLATCERPATAILNLILEGAKPSDDVAILTIAFQSRPARGATEKCA
jgi:serine phosphatase RsbU (regulator of sigma subunit)